MSTTAVGWMTVLLFSLCSLVNQYGAIFAQAAVDLPDNVKVLAANRSAFAASGQHQANLYFGNIFSGEDTEVPEMLRSALNVLLQWFVSPSGNTQTALHEASAMLNEDPTWPIVLE